MCIICVFSSLRDPAAQEKKETINISRNRVKYSLDWISDNENLPQAWQITFSFTGWTKKILLIPACVISSTKKRYRWVENKQSHQSPFGTSLYNWTPTIIPVLSFNLCLSLCNIGRVSLLHLYTFKTTLTQQPNICWDHPILQWSQAFQSSLPSKPEHR